jgi:hypothetical protein
MDDDTLWRFKTVACSITAIHTAPSPKSLAQSPERGGRVLGFLDFNRDAPLRDIYPQIH